MLVAHMSDLHLGYSQFNLEEREEDVYETFLEAVDISIKERVKLAIIAGDIFHTPRPNGRATFKLAEGLKRLKEKQIPAAFILGEHDISRLRDVPFAYVFGSLGLARRLRLDEPLVVDGLAVFGANKERRNNIDSLVNNLQQAGKLAERHAGKRMLVLHQGLSDFNKFAGEMNSTDIPASFHYYALGHYHDHIEKRFEHLGGPLVYPGSLDLTPSEGIKEVEKGFALVDMSGEEASVNWVPLHRRPQFKATLDYGKIAEGIQGIVSKAKSLAKKPVVRVEIAGRNIDSKVIAANLVRLNDACLHYVWQPLEQEQPMQVYDERPADLDAELLRLSKEALGSDELASLAINDLLGPAAAGDAGEALEIAWEAFKRRAGP
ncbi:DNA repair exonuclease [Nitrososphaera sp.]|uniref:DNA repair exonuclease n=1 Tax=Nitrososphaera sp. TaxID=1971748 RepID=UPI0025DD9B7A|nr:DNA repair exonuclease [Nitrososphaera sp.]